jgi:hypothetical protein
VPAPPIAGSSTFSRSWLRSSFSGASASICCCVLAGHLPRTTRSRLKKRRYWLNWRNGVPAPRARCHSAQTFRSAPHVAALSSDPAHAVNGFWTCTSAFVPGAFSSSSGPEARLYGRLFRPRGDLCRLGNPGPSRRTRVQFLCPMTSLCAFR